MAGQGDDFLRGVLGDDFFADEGPGEGGDLGDHPTGEVLSATDQTTAAMDVARAEEHAQYEDVTGIAAGVVPQPPPSPNAPPGSGGGYTFDAETISALITEFESLMDDIADAGRALADAATSATAPAGDDSATSQAIATRASLTIASDHNKSLHGYAGDFLDKLRQANGTYQANEDEMSQALTQSDGQGRAVAPGALWP